MEYDPIAHYLSELPQWDGRDRLKEMASRVHTDDPQWEANFKTWMRSMVNQWGNRSRLYGSSMVMMLTGAQGTGKSTFIRLLLPPELSSYYLDRLDFTTKKEAERALTQFALINIDEFDQISKSQTAYLKHLLQKSNVVQRKLYEQTYTQSRRFAAFAATTNSPQPLVDITGSRRYMVEEVKGRIDVNTVDDKAIDYPQLYAQIVAEIQAGEPVYFDSSRERAIQQRNELFTIPDTQAEIFTSMFRKPTVEDSQETVSHLSATQIIEQMHQRHKSMKISHASIIRLGVYLSSNQYERKTIRGKVLYSVVAIDNSI
jgi:predicted P-loop ATPase